MMKSRQLPIILTLLFLCLNVFGQTGAGYKSVKIDISRRISSEEVVIIAKRFLNRSYKNIYDASEKIFVDQNFKKLEADGADKLKIAQGLSSTAVFFTGTGESQIIPVVFSAKAVTLFPNDTLIVNNFGAVLRMLDSIKTSLPVLLYAKSLYPGAPVILTNLGNTLFELYDDRSAESFYKEALRINPDYALAHHGLVSVYLKRKDLQNAIEELYKGIQGMYSQSLNSTLDKLTIAYKKKYQHSYPPPEPSGEPPDNNSSTGQKSNAPNTNVPVDNLQLPDFPGWSDIGALLYDKSIEKISKKFSQIYMSQIPGSGGNSGSAKSISPAQEHKYYENYNNPGRILNKQNVFAANLMQQYFADELIKADKKYGEAADIQSKKFGKAMDQLKADDEAKLKQAAGDIRATQAFLVQHCRDFTNLTSKYYTEWRDIAEQRHTTYVNSLSTYWIYCEQYLNRTYDPIDFEQINNARKSLVALRFGLLYDDYSLHKMIFGGINIGSFGNAVGTCPEMPPPPTPPQKAEDQVNVPDKNAPECPFKNKKGKLGLVVCSVGLDCESIEFECGEGLIGGAKWNYKNKELSLFGGAGVKADFGAEGISQLKAEGKAGFEVSFNNKGQVTDVGYKTEVGGGASLGKVELMQNLEVKMTAETGLDISRTTELTVGVVGED